MNISLGFLVILLFIIFPGLIYRRLYFYGEFSKEFSGEMSLIYLISLAILPGALLLLISFSLYNIFSTPISGSELISAYQTLINSKNTINSDDVNNSLEATGSKIKDLILLLYGASVLLGSIGGRLVRIFRLDTKFKLLRFKNYWFYLLNGQHTDFKKLKHLKQENKVHLFTKADILINTSQAPQLYSGIVVDYELKSDSCSSLSKLILQNAERYSINQDGARSNKQIPGAIFVVDCENFSNINLTYVYERNRPRDNAQLPALVTICFAILYLILIPFFIFKFDTITWQLYNQYFTLGWLDKVLVYLFIIQSITLFLPYYYQESEYKRVTWKISILRLLWLIVFSIVFIVF